MRLMQRLVVGAPAPGAARRRRRRERFQRALRALRGHRWAIRIARAPFSRTACDGWLPCVPILVRFPGRSPSAPRPPYLNAPLSTDAPASLHRPARVCADADGPLPRPERRAAARLDPRGLPPDVVWHQRQPVRQRRPHDRRRRLGRRVRLHGLLRAVQQQPVEAMRTRTSTTTPPASTRSTRSRSRASTATASSPAESDLHNLYPSQVTANADRGNLPFAEILDTQGSRAGTSAARRTRRPPCRPLTSTATPSCARARAWEPRERTTRATSPARCSTWTPSTPTPTTPWFQTQLRDLYTLEPPGPDHAGGQDRSARVAVYQNGKNNPFVLDSTLARRAYYPEPRRRR